MPKRYHIELSPDERAQLKRWLRNPPKPYLRERARAILRVADGEPVSGVASTLRTRIGREAVGDWVRRFLAARVEGLRIKAGRGRKPVFSPTGRRRRAGSG